MPPRLKVAEPPQPGERRVALEREGTTAYLKFGYHAPAATEADFFPMLVLDAVLTGAKGLNLWSSFRVAPPQRKSRLYTALFERGLASQVNGALLATADPFSTRCRSPPPKACALPVLEEAVFAAMEPVTAGRIEDGEVARAKRQLRARLVFEDDSVTNIAHQLGFFETVVGPGFYPSLQSRIDAVTADQVRDVAQRRLRRNQLTVGWFQPLESR